MILVPHPSLRLLVRLKMGAWLRCQRRRLSTPSGIVFALLGLVLMCAWLASVLWRQRWGAGASLSPDECVGVAQGGLASISLLALFGSLAHRGLYLPQGELERLLSAPISRSDLVRYRMLISSSRSILFGIIMGVLFSRRLPVQGFAFAGIFVSTLTLPIMGQAAALLCGDAENRLAWIMKRMPLSILRVLAAVGFWMFFMVIFFAGELSEVFPGLGLPGSGVQGDSFGTLRSVLEHPVYRGLTLPLYPWAMAISATSLASFVPWFLGIVCAWFMLFELTARLPVDFRELSLSTSADVAKRLRRMRSGRNLITGAKVSRRTLGWNIPWLFGRGPFGAIAWWKLTSIVRKSRGTLIFSAVVIGMLTVASLATEEDPEAGAILVAVFGTIYLSWGLRFDFRADLDLMERVRAWPTSAARIFVAVILPEVLLISMLVIVALASRALFSDSLGPGFVGYCVGVPVACFMWLTIDNALFLLLPARFTPGQGGALHYTGRGLMLVLLRGLMFAAAIMPVFLVVWLVATQMQDRAYSTPLTSISAGLAGLAVAAGIAALLVAFGAWSLRRFDVAWVKTNVH